MEINYNNIKVIGFDADDTLWVNETYFRDAEIEFAKLLSGFETANKIDQELFTLGQDCLGYARIAQNGFHQGCRWRYP